MPRSARHPLTVVTDEGGRDKPVSAAHPAPMPATSSRLETEQSSASQPSSVEARIAKHPGNPVAAR